MKLVEILAREMSNWPDDGTDVVGQASDGVLHLNASRAPNRGFTDESYTLADDWRSADVTRADWEAERARIKGEKAMPKANKDGWIRHRGGKCPVEAGTLVDVKFRDGCISCGQPALMDGDPDCGWAKYWSHSDHPGDIMAWRPHKAEQVIVSDALHDAISSAAPASENQALQSLLSRKSQFVTEQDGPLQWRDRIHDIDLDKAAAQKVHEAAMSALDSERAELVAKLKAEGLMLVQAEEDMSDWRNWKPGDKLKMTQAHLWSDMTNGKLYELLKPSRKNVFSVKCDAGEIHQFNEADMASDSSPHLDFKWHSRPPS